MSNVHIKILHTGKGKTMQMIQMKFQQDEKNGLQHLGFCSLYIFQAKEKEVLGTPRPTKAAMRKVGKINPDPQNKGYSYPHGDSVAQKILFHADYLHKRKKKTHPVCKSLYC